ncbi:MAG: PRC-barrel domain-containing protein [Candidatus Bathyarchaeia archaeon]
MTKDRLIGMQVYDSEGNAAGTVQDIAFVVGKMGMTLIVESKGGDTREIAWEDIQAAGDIVILKPQGQAQSAAQSAAQPQTTQAQPQQAQATPVCPTCGGPLTFIPQYNRWYCYKDKKYV